MAPTDIALRALHVATILAAVASALVAFQPKRREGRLLDVLLLAGVASGIIGLTLRSVLSGHLPLFGTLENTWTVATVLLGIAAVAALVKGSWLEHRPLLLPWAVAFLLWGLRSRFEPVPLTISEQSVWVDIHVAFAWAAFACLLWAGTLSAVRLWTLRGSGAAAAEDEAFIARMMLVGYTFITAMILVGSWYLFVLFATFWRWEVVGTLAIVTWVGYSIAVHGWLMQGWRGRTLFVLPALMLVPLLLLYWVWSVFPGTYHFFDIPLLTPF